MTTVFSKTDGPIALRDIELIPRLPGVYAWYSIPRLYKKDLADLERRIQSAPKSQDKQDIVTDFLNKFLFQSLRESPYRVKVSGQLKPAYSGEIAHIPSISQALILRIAHNPERLSYLAQILQSSAPIFASPIYIGMAKNLRKRLSQHKKLISLLIEDPKSHAIFGNDQGSPDHSFAYEAIIERQINPSNLHVYIKTVALDNSTSVVDVENILNRLYHPLCGRN